MWFLRTITVLTMICCTTCKRTDDNTPIKGANDQNWFPVVIDTFGFQGIDCVETWRLTVGYELLYIGDKSDTIFLDYSLHSYPYYLDWQSRNPDKPFRSAYLRITVDTNHVILNEEYQVVKGDAYYNAFPVLIENYGSDTVMLGFGDMIPLIAEAKDSSGQWKPIENLWTYTCGTGLSGIFLPPEKIAISSVSIYHGDYATTLRLRLDSIVSNEFQGCINYRQFEGIFYDDGNFKREFIDEVGADVLDSLGFDPF